MRYLMMLAVIALAGCQKDTACVLSPIAPADLLSDSARAQLHLPAKSVLTLATAADMEYARSLDAAVTKTVEDFLKPTGTAFQICAARLVGRYVLLWVSFPKFADGGVDLIYSAEKRKIVGEFLGGYRG